jgi:uncharacterized membrane-anchored protein
MGEVNEHPLRATVLGEVHARPFVPVLPGTRIFHFGFVVTKGSDPLAELSAWCERMGALKPGSEAKHHTAKSRLGDLSWEQHTEFVTFSLRVPQQGRPFGDSGDGTRIRILTDPPSSGPVLVAADLHIVAQANGKGFEALFDEASLVTADVVGGRAMMATDLKPDGERFVRWLVIDKGLSPRQAGALVQRLLEIETYRNFALLGLPEAQRISPALRDLEVRMAEIGQDMTRTDGLEGNSRLLEQLTTMASRLEADAASSAYRFGASRAYHDIIRQRLAVIEEQPVGESTTLASFLDRRLAPAMRTCEATANRQADLSRKLTSAANLLRTRVDVELERQNLGLMEALNDRTRLQIRLQQTVEGLSVAAISYYVVGLFGYLAKALEKNTLVTVDANVLTGLFVPVAIGMVWLAVRRIRRSHREEDRLLAQSTSPSSQPGTGP